MSQGLTNPVTMADARQAFVTGNFSAEVMGYLKNHNVGTVVAGLPKNADSITLTPDILALEEGKQCGIFVACPQHVKTVKFNLVNLQDDHRDAAAALMAHGPYAKNVEHFHLACPANEALSDYLEKQCMKFLPVATTERVNSPSLACK